MFEHSAPQSPASKQQRNIENLCFIYINFVVVVVVKIPDLHKRMAKQHIAHHFQYFSCQSHTNTPTQTHVQAQKAKKPSIAACVRDSIGKKSSSSLLSGCSDITIFAHVLTCQTYSTSHFPKPHQSSTKEILPPQQTADYSVNRKVECDRDDLKSGDYQIGEGNQLYVTSKQHSSEKIIC